jgi:hypothetical protein
VSWSWREWVYGRVVVRTCAPALVPPAGAELSRPVRGRALSSILVAQPVEIRARPPHATGLIHEFTPVYSLEKLLRHSIGCTPFTIKVAITTLLGLPRQHQAKLP